MTDKIMIDLSGVLADDVKMWCNIYNMRYRKRLMVHKRDFHNWNMTKVVDLDYKQINDIFSEAWSYWYFIEATEYDLPSKINKIKELDLDPYILSNRVDGTEEYCKLWIEHMEIPIDDDKIIFLKNDADKTELDYKFIVDDNPNTIDKADDLDRIPFLYTQPWNVDVETKGVRILSLDDVINFLISRGNKSK